MLHLVVEYGTWFFTSQWDQVEKSGIAAIPVFEDIAQFYCFGNPRVQRLIEELNSTEACVDSALWRAVVLDLLPELLDWDGLPIAPRLSPKT